MYLGYEAEVSIRPRTAAMKKNLIRLLVIAFAVALLSTFLFYRLLVGQLASGSGAGQSIVVAARDLEAGATLTPADVKMAAIASPTDVKGAFPSLEQAVGLTVLEAIEANAPVTEARVAPQESQASASVRIPPGMRALSIHVVESTGVVAMLRPGHRVDIHAIGSQGNVAQLRTVLQNVEVLASGAQPDGGPSRTVSQVVTVLVKPAQAEVLALADSGARVRLALRNSADQEQQATRRLTVSQLFDGAMPSSKSAQQTAKADVAPARRRAAAPPVCASEGLPARTTVAKVN
jgi:pilus assembly protein CpaB